MDKRDEAARGDLLTLGPIRVVDVFTSMAPKGKEVADSIGQDAVPFEEIRHLCSAKPLRRFNRPDPKA